MNIASLLLLTLFLNIAIAGEKNPNIQDISQLDLNQYRGQVVYLDFWASWCKPCQKSFPWMNKIVEKYANKPFTLITINLDESPKAMQQFLSRVPANFQIFQDPDGQLATKFNLQGMPTSYLIDKNGAVQKKHIGFLIKDINRYEKEIEALL